MQRLAVGLRLCLGVATLAVLAPPSLAAQAGSLRVTVTDSLSARPLVGATVQVMGSAGEVLRTGSTGRRGESEARQLVAGTFTIVVRMVGYQPSSTSVTLASGETRDVTILLVRGALILEPLVVTARRIEEVLLEVPVAVSLVKSERLEQQTALTTIEYLATLPEAQVLSGGLMTRRYTTRGPNFGNSATVRTMTDFRYTTMPGIASNADYLVSTTVEDITAPSWFGGRARWRTVPTPVGGCSISSPDRRSTTGALRWRWSVVLAPPCRPPCATPRPSARRWASSCRASISKEKIGCRPTWIPTR